MRKKAKKAARTSENTHMGQSEARRIFKMNEHQHHS